MLGRTMCATPEDAAVVAGVALFARAGALGVVACAASAAAGVHTVQAAVAILIMVDTATNFDDLFM